MENKKRLIDANALRQSMESKIYWGQSNNVACLEAIDDAPTVDAGEEVHGDWDVITDDCTFDVIYQCSVCKEEFVTNDGTPAENLWNYCPNCGAKMDGGNEDG